jgi:hypothetical protein
VQPTYGSAWCRLANGFALCRPAYGRALCLRLLLRYAAGSAYGRAAALPRAHARSARVNAASAAG